MVDGKAGGLATERRHGEDVDECAGQILQPEVGAVGLRVPHMEDTRCVRAPHHRHGTKIRPLAGRIADDSAKAQANELRRVGR